jgi:hypothetical protein
VAEAAIGSFLAGLLIGYFGSPAVLIGRGLLAYLKERFR